MIEKEQLEEIGHGVVDYVESVCHCKIDYYDTEYNNLRYCFTFKSGYNKKMCEIIVYDIIQCLCKHQLFSDHFVYSLIYHKDSKSWECRMICIIG